MDDHHIVELIRTGSNDLALKALYQNFGIIRKLIRSRGGTTKDAEDIFQEALIILLNKARDPQSQLTLTSKLSTWLFSVSRFLWNDQLKRRQSHIPVDDVPSLGAVESVGTDAAICEETRMRLVEQIIHNLKDRCRELLLLFYHHKLDLDTIAGRMGYSSANTAKNQKYKCLEAARNQLKAQLATQTA